MYFCVDEFEVGVNDGIFSGNNQQKVYLYSLALPNKKTWGLLLLTS